MIVEAAVKRGMFRELVPLVEALMPQTRAFEGCLKAEILASHRTDRILLIQDWETKAHQKECREWRESTGMYRVVAAYLAGPITFTWFNVS